MRILVPDMEWRDRFEPPSMPGAFFELRQLTGAELQRAALQGIDDADLSVAGWQFNKMLNTVGSALVSVTGIQMVARDGAGKLVTVAEETETVKDSVRKRQLLESLAAQPEVVRELHDRVVEISSLTDEDKKKSSDTSAALAPESSTVPTPPAGT